MTVKERRKLPLNHRDKPIRVAYERLYFLFDATCGGRGCIRDIFGVLLVFCCLTVHGHLGFRKTSRVYFNISGSGLIAALDLQDCSVGSIKHV